MASETPEFSEGVNRYYAWMPWFDDLVKAISAKDEAYLSEKTAQVALQPNSNGVPNLLKFEPENIDPFSFIRTVAYNTRLARFPQIARSINRVFELPDRGVSFEDMKWVFPAPGMGFNLLFHDGKTFSPELLWRLFREAVNGEIDAGDFKNSLEIKGVGIAKLTQTLFIVNPQEFLPVDSATAGKGVENRIKKDGLDAYKAFMHESRQEYYGCENSEINTFRYLQQARSLVNEETKFFQINSDVHADSKDHWHEFDKKKQVHTSEPGSKSGKAGSLVTPRRGDVILVRFGETEGRGIGIVDDNGYENGWSKDSGIQVHWINKQDSKLENTKHTPHGAISSVDKRTETYQAFKNSDAYGSTMKFVEEMIGRRPKQKLNRILYGPPGTGKTYATRKLSVEICDGEKERDVSEIDARYKELVESGNVRFITFHQSYGYEDFVEGLRPQTSDAAAGFRLEAKPGVLKEVADDARNRTKERFVLVIDEINRANVSKVMGELITLLEEDKRERAENEIAVTLAYSQDEFALPANVYILGTMNTADRSIALLDTALRRRFRFVELPPKPELLGMIDSDGIDLEAVLKCLNDRMEWLLDRDHLLGHAWFMNVESRKDLDEVMRDKIIPLVAEYFYDDWDKVMAVFGGNKNAFISREKLDTPPGLDTIASEERYRWSINDTFSADAYSRLCDPDSSPDAGEADESDS